MVARVKGFELHPGHWYKTNSGANGIINEVTEARRVTREVHRLLTGSNVSSTYIEDNVSSNQRSNINYLVSQHNKDRDDLIVSIHFNASGNTTNDAIGTEVLYYSEKDLAVKVVNAISKVSGLKNRGAKYRDNIGVLTQTYEPAILIEICFVNSVKDVELYKQNFDKICYAIAQTLAAFIGKSLENKEELTVGQYEELKKEIAELKQLVGGKADLVSKSNAASSHKENWEWAKEAGITNGENPGGALTRQQMVTMLKRYYDNFIKNSGEVSASHKDAWDKLIALGITNGSDPKALINREQVGTMIVRALEK